MEKTIEKIIIQTIVVEDEDDIATYLLKQLELKLHRESYEYKFIRASDIEEFTKVQRAFSEDVLVINNYIIDINLEGYSKVEGLEVIKIINESEPKANPIVLTGSPNSREDCYKLGISEDRFLLKGQGDILTKITGFIDVDIHKIISDSDDLYSSKLRTKVSKYKNELDPKGGIIIPPMIKEKTYILSDLESVFNGIESNSSKLAILKLLLSPFSKGYSYYSTDNELIEFNTTMDLEVLDKIKSDIQYSLEQVFNEENGFLEKIILEKEGENILDLAIPSSITPIEDIGEQLFGEENYLHLVKGESFIAQLVQTFFAKRLSELFITEDTGMRLKLIGLAEYIGKKGFTELEFTTLIWEWAISTGVDYPDSLKAEMEELKNKNLPEIKDIFYGSVETKNEKEGIVEVLLASIEDLKKSFVKAFDIKLFAQNGVSNPSSNFKLIIYNDRNNETDDVKPCYFIEPIPRKIYLQKLATA